jgi:hypothetical protein
MRMDGDTLAQRAEQLSSREEFLAFLEDLAGNLRECPHEWENDTLATFLNGLRGFAASAAGYYANVGENDVDVSKPSWRLFGDMLLAAKVYE